MGDALSDGTIRVGGPRDAALTPTSFEEFAAELAQRRRFETEAAHPPR